MKTKTSKFYFLFLIALIYGCHNNQDFPTLKGEYFGQRPPGDSAVIFAPGLVSTGINELSICFSPGGDRMFYFICGPAFNPRIILESRIENSIWTEPKELPFLDHGRSDSYPFMSPDGEKLFFNSGRSYDNNESNGTSRHHQIWFVEKMGEGWSDPVKVDFGGEYKGYGTFPSVALNGNIYFNASFDRDVSDLYYSKYEEGRYSIPERLSDSVNSSSPDFHPYIAPDESYIMFDSMRREGSFGRQDIYIAFRKTDGSWGEAINIGEKVNTPGLEMRPYVTVDQKYLFFVSMRVNLTGMPENRMTGEEAAKIINGAGNGSQDIYWIEARFIDELKKHN